jgi:hypothetical protein
MKGESNGSIDTLLQVPIELRTKVDELNDDAEFAYICYVIFGLICLLTLFVLLYITIQVIKMVGSADKTIPLMLIML